MEVFIFSPKNISKWSTLFRGWAWHYGLIVLYVIYVFISLLYTFHFNKLLIKYQLIWMWWCENPWPSNGEGPGQVQILPRIPYGVHLIHECIRFFFPCHCLLLIVVWRFWSVYLMFKGVDFIFLVPIWCFWLFFSYIIESVHVLVLEYLGISLKIWFEMVF